MDNPSAYYYLFGAYVVLWLLLVLYLWHLSGKLKQGK